MVLAALALSQPEASFLGHIASSGGTPRPQRLRRAGRPSSPGGPARWCEALAADVSFVPGGATLVVPLGSTEQRGPHLPLGTDTAVALAVCDRLAARRADVVVAPALPYGSSGEHAGFAGTLSIGQDALEQVVVELVRSADAFTAVVLVSGHGGNAEPLARAVAVLRARGGGSWPGRPASPAATPTPGGPDLAAPGPRPGRRPPGPGRARGDRAAAVLLDALRAGGVRAVSPTASWATPPARRPPRASRSSTPSSPTWTG